VRIDTPRIVFLFLFCVVVLAAQTTQGLIEGSVADSLSGNPIPGARVVASSRSTNLSQSVVADASGFYVLPLLSPGTYLVRAEADGYQSLEVQELELPVAGTLTLPFRLRQLSNVWEQKQYQSIFLAGNSVLPLYGPDVDTSRSGNFEPALAPRGLLDISVSTVIDPDQIASLPLQGRDVYALLVTLPGVTADTSTGRGLGLSVNGQRPTSSNFLLDGLENDNYLVTGPTIPVPPEAVQEYRISTNNYSAEYGRTSGFVANAVTRTGGQQWHGLAYFTFGNEALDANQFQRNRTGLARPSDKDWQPGFSAGGPLRKERLFASASFEYQRFRGAEDPEPVPLPTRNFIPPAGSLAEKLMRGFDAPAGPGLTTTLLLSPPNALNRWSALPRADYLFHQGTQRFLARAKVVRLERPDFIWTPYPGFSSPLTQGTSNLLAAWLGSWGGLSNEARAGWTLNDLRFDRAQSSIPVLGSPDAVLPGSPANYGFHNRDSNLQFLDNVFWVRNRHALKFGGGALIRSIEGYLTAGQDGYFSFPSLDAFAADQANSVRVALSRIDFVNGIRRPPDYNRSYRQNQVFFFAQDSFRATSRLVFNLGLRYEKFGAPVNTGAVKDPTLALDPSLPISQAVLTARVQPGPSGVQSLYATSGTWAVRAGASWSLRANGHTLLRASYGTFYDRPFDNLWENLRNNSVAFGSLVSDFPVAIPVASLLPSLDGIKTVDTYFTKFYLFSPRLNAPRVQSYFVGLSHEFTRSLIVEADSFNSAGNSLITTDQLNRSGQPGNPDPNLGVILYRANEGFSSYHALAFSARYQTSRAQFRVTYTWSHSIDNQSDPLAGDFYDLLPTIPGANTGASLPGFGQQFDSRGDRGNSDFDQRHDLVALGIWRLPQPRARSRGALWLRDWQASFLAALRSGFPYTVTSPVLTERLALVNPALFSAPRTPSPGGMQLFEPGAFDFPSAMYPATSRNQFGGPGLYSMDVSLSRSWPLRSLGESGRIVVRADAFNALNHANLGNPVAVLGTDFGVALYGRKEHQPDFPALTPFNESARQLQLLLRLEF
jgi:hypothetical protein